MNKDMRGLVLASPQGQLAEPFDPRLAYRDAYWEEETKEGGVDLRALWSILYRNRLLIAAVVFLGLAAGLASALLTAPTYRASSSIEVAQQSQKILNSQDVDPAPSAQEAERFLQTQLDILKSRALANRVAESLDLYKPAFLTTMNGKAPDETLSRDAQRELVLRTIRENLGVSMPRLSRIVTISFDSRDPKLAARIADSYTDNFIKSNLQRKFDTSSYSREFLQGQLVEAKAKLETSERSMISYARSAGLIDASAGSVAAGEMQGPRSLTTSNLVQINQAYSQARSQRVQAQQRWQQAQSTPVMSLPEVLSNPAVQQLTQRRAEAQALYQQELERRLPDHPAVKQAGANIAELDRQIATLASSIRGSIRDQYQVASRQESALAGNVGQLKGETLSEQDRGVKYNILKREVDTNRELYDGLLQRFKEVSAAAGITPNNVSVIDKAEPPTRPISPRPILNTAAGGIAGLMFALMLAFAREKFDDVVRAPDDLENKLNVPLLGVVPLLHDKRPPVEVLDDPRSALSEAHYSLRTSLELSAGGVPQTLLLTSSRQSEGKSTTAYGIAKDFAGSGKKVLLVDADLRKPSLHRVLNVENKVGLSNVLAAQRQFHDAVRPTATPNLWFLSSGPLPPSPGSLLASNRMGEFLANVSQHYDLVVIDGPPVLGLADAPRLSSIAEGTIFVVEANGAHRGNAKAALKRLLESNSRLVGAVLTKFDAKKIGYGDGYGYYSYRYTDDTKPALTDG